MPKTIKQTIEDELQILGCRKVTVKEFPGSARWGVRYAAWTPPSRREGVFLFIGAAGAVREGKSPSTSFSNPALRKKLLDRASIRDSIGAKAPPQVLSADALVDLIRKGDSC